MLTGRPSRPVNSCGRNSAVSTPLSQTEMRTGVSFWSAASVTPRAAQMSAFTTLRASR